MTLSELKDILYEMDSGYLSKDEDDNIYKWYNCAYFRQYLNKNDWIEVNDVLKIITDIIKK